ncbi:Heparinase II/III-like protein [Jannaschia seosinensis]|uniref:Heparinase II/III-like protein n=1 Tax=Jannaschia seosinensis TaxID=313367 RepID=A0A0M7B4B1_9RHOB|nr:heparinase II/III family protein [Jannaschia seosinensis]CUH16118.1 Heparinase II/III-like protein [Jannaschia seosinensis]
MKRPGQGIRDRWRTRLAVLRARPGRGPRAIVWGPESRGIGSARRGQLMLSGIWHLGGNLVEAPGANPWTIDPPSAPFEMQIHGQGWLDDLLAADGHQVRAAAQEWVLDWVRRYGRGTGPGWDPALTGRRVLRWISHAPTLLQGMPPGDRAMWFAALYTQANYLQRRWRDAPAGLPRIEALTGLLHARLALEGRAGAVPEAAAALIQAVTTDLGPEAGALPSRNPEALMEVAMLLGWCIDALATRAEVPEGMREAQAAIIPTLRALRHADGGLARFHGGGRGRPGRLDRVLSRSGVRARNSTGLAMGFAPLMHGRTSVIVDAAPPPSGAASGSAHASTLAFEMTSGPCPVIVNCGPGGGFGVEWHRAGRATASHSTLEIEGYSSSRIGAPIPQGHRLIAPLVQQPRRVQWQANASRRSSTIVMAHDGYGASHGLTHLRRLVLSTDGRILAGEDSLRAVSRGDKDRFDDVQVGQKPHGVPFHIRFHLHPDTEAEIDLGGRAVSLGLPSGEVWIFRAGGDLRPTLEPSVHLEPGRLKPRPAEQVVFSGRAVAYATTVEWSLKLAQEAAPSPSGPQANPQN